jgi:hypothetical protein
MDLKNEIQAIIMQAAEIKQLKEQMIRELNEMERYHVMKRDELARDLAKLEIKMALRDMEDDNELPKSTS